MISSKSKVIIFHDETKDVPGWNIKGHVLLFVPKTIQVVSDTPIFGKNEEKYQPEELFINKIKDCRQEYSCDGKLHFCDISGKRWSKYDYAYQKVLLLAVDALRSKSQKLFPHPLKFKVATIFYPKGRDLDIYGGDSRKEQKLRHDETLLRILLKGACHYLYDKENLIEITNIISDGDSSHRNFNEDRVLWKLTYDELYGRTSLRDYVIIPPTASIIHLPSNHNNYQVNSDEFAQSNLLQVADMMLGAIMRICFTGGKQSKLIPQINEICSKKDVITLPVREMIEKKTRGKGFINSGHYKSFSITRVEFSKDGIKFREVNPIEVDDNTFTQLELSNDFSFSN